MGETTCTNQRVPYSTASLFTNITRFRYKQEIGAGEMSYRLSGIGVRKGSRSGSVLSSQEQTQTAHILVCADQNEEVVKT